MFVAFATETSRVIFLFTGGTDWSFGVEITGNLFLLDTIRLPLTRTDGERRVLDVFVCVLINA